jgi:integrase
MPKQRRNGEGGVYYEADRKRWRVDITLPDGQPKYVGRFKTEKEAIKAKAEALRNAEQGTIATGPRQTVSQWLGQWLEDVIRPNRAAGTYRTYRDKVRLHILPELGKLPLTALTADHLQRLYARKQREGLAGATVEMIHIILFGSLKMARRRGYVGRNVAEDVDPPQRRPMDGIERALSEEQIGVLVRAMKGHRFEPFWTLLLHTGMRFGEAAALRWDDVDFERRALRVQRGVSRVNGRDGFRFTPPKTAKSRRAVPLNAAAVAALRTQRLAANQARLTAGPKWHDLNLVFPNGVGKPLREDHVLQAFHRLCASAGLPRKRLHDLRHSAASHAYANGADLRDIQDLLGHSKLEITSAIYTASAPDRLRAAVDRLGRLFEEDVPARHAAPSGAVPAPGLPPARSGRAPQ